MKTFRYPKGHLRGTTMTVAELREKLNEYPQDMPVLATWEGTTNHIQSDNFSVEKYDGKGGEICHADDNCECLVIDVDGT